MIKLVNCLSNLPWNKPKVLPWLILTFAALNVIFLGGKRRAFGSFIAELREEFPNVTLTELNWIGDSYAAVGYMTSGLSTMMILYFNRRYGLFQFIGSLFILFSCISSAYVPNPHWLFLSHTLLHGLGSSMIISSVGLVVNENFDYKHPYHIMATTLVSGGSVASIVFVTLFAYLIQQYTWRIAFLILGAIFFAVCGSASLFFKKNYCITEVTDKKKLFCSFDEISSKQIPLLFLWFIDRVMTDVVTYGLVLNLTDYVHRINPNLVSSTMLTTLFAAGEGLTYVIGAVITAATTSFFKDKLRYVLLISSLIMAISLMVLEFTSHINLARQLLCFIAGFTIGPSVTFLYPAGEELTRLPGHIAYPFSLGGMGVGMLLSPLLTAKIAEVFLYKWFFFVQGCLIFIKVLCLLTITLLLMSYKNNHDDDDVSDIISIDNPPKVKETSQLIPQKMKARS